MDESAGQQIIPINRIKVAVRVRPVLPFEDPHNVAVTCAPDGTKVQVTIPPKEYSKPAVAATTRSDGKAYEFDACLNGSTSQAQLFDVCGMEELVEAAVEGYNVTIFAFGQTGSGKTHTILGPRLGRLGDGLIDPTLAARYGHQHHLHQSINAAEGGAQGSLIGEEEGVLLRCLHKQYKLLEAWAAENPHGTWSVDVSCCEIYNETITDMLGQDKAKQLQVRQDPRQGSFYVEGLTQVPCSSLAAALDAISAAMSWRHTRSHKLNNYSSRSHCLVTLVIRRQESGENGGPGMRRLGKLAVVDLAGSERLKETGNSDKEAVRETGYINKSLFTLGQVLAALSARSDLGVPVHIPYRDSKLTQLLWEGLRGDGRALMLACLGPLRQHAEESLNTLHFAGMALRIKSQPIMLIDPADQQVLELKTTIRTLREDIKQLAGAIHQLSTGAELGSVLKTLPPTLLQDALRAGSAYSAPTGTTRGKSPGMGRTMGSSLGGGRQPGGPLVDSFLPAVRSSSPTRSYQGPGSPARYRGTGSREQLHRHSWNMCPPGSSRGGRRPLGVTGDTSTFQSLRASFPTSPNRARSQQGGFMGATNSCSSYNSIGRWPVNRAWTGASAHRPFNGYGGVPAAMAHDMDALFGGATAADILRGSGQMLPGLGGGLGPASIPNSSFPELAALEAQFQQVLAARTGALGDQQEPGPGPPRTAFSPVLNSAALQPTKQQQQHHHSISMVMQDPQPGGSAVARMLAAYEQQQQQQQQLEQKQADVAAAAAAAAAAAGEPPPPPPEPKALHWAERNMWFGADEEMTQLAYEVHDVLVDQEKIDASSDAYYDAIEERVKAKFPEKWEHWQKVAADAAAERAANGKVAAEQAAAARASAEAQRTQQIAALRGFNQSPTRGSQNFTSFKVPLKEGMPKPLGPGLQLGASIPLSAALPGAAFAQQMLAVYQQGSSPGAAAVPSGSNSSSNSHPSSPLQLPRSPLSAATAAGDDVPSTSGRGSGPDTSILPGDGRYANQQQLSIQGTWSQQRLLGGPILPGPDNGKGVSVNGISYLSPAAGQLLASTSSTYFDGAGPLTAGHKAAWGQVGPAHGQAVSQVLRASFNPGQKSMGELQSEYNSARQLVMSQLRQARDEAERERRTILLSINRALAAGRWS